MSHIFSTAVVSLDLHYVSVQQMLYFTQQETMDKTFSAYSKINQPINGQVNRDPAPVISYLTYFTVLH